MYRIRGADQKEYGPVNADTMREWIRDRRANAQTVVQAEGSPDWKPLSEFPEFTDALKAASAPPLSPAAGGTASAAMTAPKTSGLAISSLVLGVFGLFSCGVSAMVGLVLGVVALMKIRNSNGTLSGTGMAIAGICISALFSISGLAIGAAMLLPALAKAKAKAQTINCMNNMKQIGLAARMWSQDHNGTFPPDFLSMSNELSTPKILVCPADSRRAAPVTLGWEQFNPQNVSYEYVSPGIKEDAAMAQAVIFRCPIHNNVGMGDGSVQIQGRGMMPPRPRP